MVIGGPVVLGGPRELSHGSRQLPLQRLEQGSRQAVGCLNLGAPFGRRDRSNRRSIGYADTPQLQPQWLKLDKNF